MLKELLKIVKEQVEERSVAVSVLNKERGCCRIEQSVSNLKRCKHENAVTEILGVSLVRTSFQLVIRTSGLKSVLACSALHTFFD